MKKGNRIISALTGLIGLLTILPAYSQDESPSKFSVNADIYSNYLWRGTKFGTGPNIQPSVKYNGNLLTVGAWGSVDVSGYQEADLFFYFTLPAGLTIGMSDYYYPGLKYFNYTDTAGSHVYEINLGFTKGNFTLSANYIVNKAGGAGSIGGDKYFQAGYTVKKVNLFVGAGDGWHTYDAATGKSKFAVCNVGIGTTKEIEVTDKFKIPVVGQVILNPDKEQMYIVVGFTF